MTYQQAVNQQLQNEGLSPAHDDEIDIVKLCWEEGSTVQQCINELRHRRERKSRNKLAEWRAPEEYPDIPAFPWSAHRTQLADLHKAMAEHILQLRIAVARHEGTLAAHKFVIESLQRRTTKERIPQ